MSDITGRKTRGKKVHSLRQPLRRHGKAVESKETTATATLEASGLSPRDPVSNASQADVTLLKGDAQDSEAGAALTVGTVGPGEQRTRPPELDKQPSTETDLQPVGPTSSESSLSTVADRASVSSSGTEASVTGDVQNVRDDRGELALPVSFRPREGPFLHETAATSGAPNTALPPAGGFDKGSATTGSEEVAQSSLNAAPCGTRTKVIADGTYATSELFGSADAGVADAEADRLHEASTGQVLPPCVATGQQAAAQAVDNRDRDTPTDRSRPVSRKASVAAAAARSATSPIGLEDADKENITVQPSVQSTMSSVSRRSSTSRPGGTKAPRLDESFYERIAVIGRSPRIAMLPSNTIEIRVILLLATIIGAILSIVLLIAIIMAVLKEDNEVKTCNTFDCLVHASLLKASLNLSVDPCDDFSAYVCSSWVPKKAAFREKLYSVMDSMLYTWYDHFGDTLRRGSTKLPVGKKALAMYEMCMKASSSDDGTGLHIPLILSLFGHLPAGWHNISNQAVSVISLAALLAYKYQSPFWLSINVLDRYSSASRRVVVKPGAYLPLFLRQHKVAASSYGQYMKAFYNAYLNQSGELSVLLTDDRIRSVRDMEADVLGQLNYVYSQMAEPAVFPFGKLAAMVANGSAGNHSLFQNFRDALPLQPRLTPRDMVLASHATLFEVLVGLVAKYGDAELKYLLIWEFVQVYLPLGDLRLLVTLYGSKSKANSHRHIYCAYHVEASFKVLVLSVAVVAGFAAESRDRIDAHFDVLVATAIKKVRSAAWLDEESKIRVVNKLARVKKQMWPRQSLQVDDVLEKIYRDISENETSVAEFWIKTHTTMAEVSVSADYMEALRLPANYLTPYIDYDYIFNSVEVAASIAAAPAFYRDGTAAMFYGGLGLLMAMQLVRFIDKKGLKWASAEVMVDSILSSSSRQAYDDRFHCLSEYSYTRIFPEIPALEIVQSALAESHDFGAEEHLALSPDLPEGKVFFLTICYMACARPGHSDPVAADCNKLVQNSHYFAKVFNCPNGSRMNPQRKCSFFS
ncbi:hypothetical protein HPB52_016630 [Rhipicephalus sanguineus]|uniref:Peptidase M13 N-terminal domain-containing protein n=1 Tax=Rhipicephalus sanguineus TaxID=34632 RepID=A0A9D4QBE0_RHISA|nr:hypothetical protein HPB52_016630 [Rhipicephalus sanguineus]